MIAFKTTSTTNNKMIKKNKLLNFNLTVSIVFNFLLKIKYKAPKVITKQSIYSKTTIKLFQLKSLKSKALLPYIFMGPRSSERGVTNNWNNK